jgi:putative ABC transport system permease protein
MLLKYKKIVVDIKSDYPKSILLMLSIAIGVFATGTVLGGYTVLKREMARNYLGTNPASATIELSENSVSPALAAWVEALPDVAAAERHATINARMKIDGDWRRLLLFVVDDFARKQTNKVRPISGAAIPGPGPWQL